MRNRHPPEREGPIIAAVYARVSTDAQKEGISLEEQEIRMLEYAENIRATVPEEYRFREHFSGLKDLRPEYEKIRRLVRERKINCLIVTSSDRHQRDPGIGTDYRAELRRFGCSLHYVTEGEVDIYTPEGEILNTMKDTFNRYWLVKILQTTQDKKYAYAQRGVPLQQGFAKYGFVRVGKKDQARLEHDPEAAETVRRIYHWVYYDRIPVSEVVRRLRGIPTPNDLRPKRPKTRAYGEWSSKVVYEILHDEIYAGTYWAYRYEVFEGDNGKPRKRLRPREEWLPCPVPPIVERHVWEGVQRILEENKRKVHVRMAGTREFLLTRKGRCALCGYHVVGSANSRVLASGERRYYHYYQCYSQSHKAAAAPCSSRLFDAFDVDARVWEKIADFLRSPRSIAAELRATQAHQQEAQTALDEQRQDLQNTIKARNRELERLAMALSKHEEDSPAYAAIDRQMRELSDLIKSIEAQLKKLEVRYRQRVLSDQEISSVEEQARAISPLLDTLTHQRRREIIASFGFTFEFLDTGKRQLVYVCLYDWKLPVEVTPPRHAGKYRGRRRPGREDEEVQ